MDYVLLCGAWYRVWENGTRIFLTMIFQTEKNHFYLAHFQLGLFWSSREPKIQDAEKQRRKKPGTDIRAGLWARVPYPTGGCGLPKWRENRAPVAKTGQLNNNETSTVIKDGLSFRKAQGREPTLCTRWICLWCVQRRTWRLDTCR